VFSVLVGLLGRPVRADMVLLNNTTLVTGQESGTFAFVAPGPGTVTANITNVDWPQTLSGLSFMASAPGQVLAFWSDPTPAGNATTTQTLSFQVQHAGTYFANVNAASGGPLDIGVYSFSLHFNGGSPVPLPASGWLLAAALIVLLGMLRSSPHRPEI
jgi:hypothetical protein